MNNALLTSQNAISREVKSSIARAGISQANLAKALSISPGSLSEKINGKISFSIDDLLIIAGTLGLSLTELLGEALTSQRVPAPSYIEDEKGKKKVAPIGFIPNGTTYQMVAGAGFEPAASGLQDPIFSQVLKTTFLLKKLYTIGALKGEGH